MRIAVLMVVTQIAVTVIMIAMTATTSNNEKPRFREPELLPTFTRPSASRESTLPATIATAALHPQRFQPRWAWNKRERPMNVLANPLLQ